MKRGYHGKPIENLSSAKEKSSSRRKLKLVQEEIDAEREFKKVADEGRND